MHADHSTSARDGASVTLSHQLASQSLMSVSQLSLLGEAIASAAMDATALSSLAIGDLQPLLLALHRQAATGMGVSIADDNRVSRV